MYELLIRSSDEKLINAIYVYFEGEYYTSEKIQDFLDRLGFQSELETTNYDTSENAEERPHLIEINLS